MANGRPFDEYEERFLLAEILKDTTTPPTYLLACINQLRIQPRWTEIALPYGRSVSACQKAYDRLQGIVPGTYTASQQPEEPPSTPARIKKRTQAVAPAAATETNVAGFSSFATVNEPGISNAPSSSAQSPGGKSQKKRGRPSKGDIEARIAEAAERGEVYQHPEPKRARKPPKETAPVTMTFASGQEGDPAIFGGLVAQSTPGSSAPKKRPSKPKAPRESEVNIEANATAASALGGPSETQPQIQAMETQSMLQNQSEQSLSAGLQERADQVRSSTTKAGFRSQPRTEQEPSQQPSPKAEIETKQPEQTTSPSSNVETHRPVPASPQAESEPYQTPYQPDSTV